MKKILLASAALLTLALAAPSIAASDHHGDRGGGSHQAGGQGGGGHQGGGQGGGGHQGGGHQGGGRQAGGQGGGGQGGGGQGGGGQGGGGHRGGGHQGRGLGGAAMLAPGGLGGGGTGHRNHTGHANTGAITGGSNALGAGRGGGHAGRGHNSAFDSLRRVFNAPHHYRHGGYNRPSGWYAHRWNYGEFLPALFYSRNYWISDYGDFDLSDPPPGTVWVRYGDDALLIDEYSGEVIEVVYGLFY